MRVAGAVMTVSALLAFCPSATAIPITVDMVLADNPSITTADASVDMVIDPSNSRQLIITLRNLLSGGPRGAGGLLTGIAFDLPDDMNIQSGSVVVGTGSQILGGSLNSAGGGTDVSGEWGFLNGISGHFNDAALTTDTQVSAMGADVSNKFSTTRIDPPTVLDGPDFGLLGVGENRGRQTAIEDSVIITLLMDHTLNGGFLNGINGGIVAVTYGSPTGATVPDASTTAMLLGVALLGLEGLRRRIAK
jgi:hypothetical protein